MITKRKYFGSFYHNLSTNSLKLHVDHLENFNADIGAWRVKRQKRSPSGSYFGQLKGQHFVAHTCSCYLIVGPEKMAWENEGREGGCSPSLDLPLLGVFWNSQQIIYFEQRWWHSIVWEEFTTTCSQHWLHCQVQSKLGWTNWYLCHWHLLQLMQPSVNIINKSIEGYR